MTRPTSPSWRTPCTVSWMVMEDPGTSQLAIQTPSSGPLMARATISPLLDRGLLQQLCRDSWTTLTQTVSFSQCQLLSDVFVSIQKVHCHVEGGILQLFQALAQ